VNEAYTLDLTRNESKFLLDAISIMTPLMEREEAEVLVLKIGAAFLDTEQGARDGRVALSVRELWVLKEVTKSAVMVGQEPVGLQILQRVIEGLLTLSSQSDVRAAVAPFGEGNAAETDKNDVKRWMEDFRWEVKGRDHGENPIRKRSKRSRQDRPGDNSGNGTRSGAPVQP
jgi:hypothetical protein